MIETLGQSFIWSWTSSLEAMGGGVVGGGEGGVRRWEEGKALHVQAREEGKQEYTLKHMAMKSLN